MFRASDIFGRGPGNAINRPTTQLAQTAAPAQKRMAGNVLKNKVWDPATGEFLEEDLPDDLQELMGIRKKVKTEHGPGDAAAVWGVSQPPRTLGPATVGLSSKVKLEMPGTASTRHAPAGVDVVDRSNVCIEFRGFGKVELNEAYFEKPELKIHGRPTYWTSDGQYFIYWQGEVHRWAICDGSSLPAVRAGQYPGWAYKGDRGPICTASGWLEAFGGEWQEPEIEVAFRSAAHHKPQWNDPKLQQSVTQIEYHGFTMLELNTTYHLKSNEILQGRPSYWDQSGVYFIYWQKQMNRWAVCDLKCLDAVKQGQCPGWAYRADSTHFANACGWMENRADQWAAGIIETTATSANSKGVKVELSGFFKSELNGQYTEKASEEIQGKCSYWDSGDTYFIYWQSQESRWAICDRVSLGAAKQGLSPGWAYCTHSRHFSKSSGWMESWGREWRSANVKCIVLDGVIKELPSAIVKAEPGAVKAEPGNRFSFEQYRTLVDKVYSEKNPDKLKDVDHLFDRWVGREHALFQSICTKYGVDPDSFISETLPDEVGAGDGDEGVGKEDELAALEEAEVPELDACQYASHIQAIYEHYNVKKLVDLARLLQNYRNRERELYHEVCKKYGVHPAKWYYKALKEDGRAPLATGVKKEWTKKGN